MTVGRVRPPNRRLVTLLVAASLLTLCSVGADGAAPPAAASLYVSADGNDSGDCTQSAPCKTFNDAYHVARPGQVVEIAGGSYPPQKITVDSEKTSEQAVVFRPAPDATVRSDTVSVFGSNITFAGTGLDIGFVFGAWWAQPGSRGLTFDRVNTGIFAISGASGITVRGGQVGPWPYGSDTQVSSRDGVPPTNILIDGVYFHDVQRDSPDDHTECLQFGAGQNVVIRNSRFERCSDHDVFIRSWNSEAGNKLSNFVIENNFFGTTTLGYYAGQFARTGQSTCDGFVLRDNVLEQGWVMACNPPGDVPGAVQVTGNYWASPPPLLVCATTGTWSLNIYEDLPSGKCEPTAKGVFSKREINGLSQDRAVSGVRATGFRCGTSVTGEAETVNVCKLSGRKFSYRILVISRKGGSVRLISAQAVRRSSGTSADAARMLAPLASLPFDGSAKRVARAQRFVQRWLGRTASAKFGSTRLRVYGDESSLDLLVSAA